jgi:electron transport complex protein RnfB
MKPNKDHDRRSFLRRIGRGIGAAALAGSAGYLLIDARRRPTVWQIDPYTCIACGNCATHCVLQESAVKCVHAYARCGYCQICFGFFGPEPVDITEAAENQLCPTGAIKRTFVEDPYYQYTIDESLCNGCGKCVKGCNTFGNGSLFLQVRHDRCLNCNECAIAAACPSGAYKRVPAGRAYMLKEVRGE